MILLFVLFSFPYSLYQPSNCYHNTAFCDEGSPGMQFSSYFLFFQCSASELFTIIDVRYSYSRWSNRTYFNLGLSAREITLFLASLNGFCMSLRQLKRILRRLGCRAQSSLGDIIEAVEEELRGSGNRVLRKKVCQEKKVCYEKKKCVRKKSLSI